MPQRDELVETIEARIFTVQEGDAPRTRGTRATLRLPPDTGDPDAELARLAALRAGVESALDIEETLGEGGMGVVTLATQRSLGRKVAVKTTRVQTPEAVVRLVREAKITGTLEHPNIVPVHDLTTGADGSPRLVLKRIEGTTWSARMTDDEGVRAMFAARDLLEWNLQTLAQVCQAVHFAHSRGVVHRDLKPDNVMVGNFGEVYVMDWGIAVRMGEAGGADPRGVAVGTPVYMAPEMLLGETLDARTDVYLLGAILFELLSGRPPHDHALVRDVVQSVLDTPPPMPAGAPEELVSLARSCLARSPQDRPASAEDVRRALASFLRHRDSTQLAARAEAKVVELEAAARAEGDERARAPRLYGECLFGFRAALEAWPENPHAGSGLARAVRAMVEHDLAMGMSRTAAIRLDDLPDADPELRARVDAALQAAEQEKRRVAELRRLEVEVDPATGRRVRLRVAAVLFVFWIFTDAIDQLWVKGTRWETHVFFAAQSAAQAVVAMLLFAAYWRYIARSRLNRQLAGIATFCLLSQALAYLGAYVAQWDLPTAQGALFFLWFWVVGMLAATMVREMWPAAVVFLLCFFVSTAWPELRHLVGAIGNASLLVNAIVVWRARAARASSGRRHGQNETGTSTKRML